MLFPNIKRSTVTYDLAIFEYQKGKIPLSFRTLSLPYGIKPLPYDSEYWQILNFQPCQCLRLSTSQCHQKIYYLPDL